jgi:hypothetical protein
MNLNPGQTIGKPHYYRFDYTGDASQDKKERRNKNRLDEHKRWVPETDSGRVYKAGHKPRERPLEEKNAGHRLLELK